MFRLLKRHKGTVAVMILWALIAGAVNIYAGYQLGAFYDIITASDLKQAIWISLYMVFFWILAVVMTYFSSCYQAKLIKVLNTDMRGRMLERISNLSYDEYEKKEPGEYASWLVNDITQIENNSIVPFCTAVESLSTALFALIALFVIHPVVLAACCVCSVMFSIVPKIFEKSLTQISTQLSAANESFSQRVFNTIQGFEVFVVANQRNEMSKRLRGMYLDLEERKLKLRRKNAEMIMYSHSIYRISDLGVSVLTSIMALLQMVEMGAVFSISNISNRFLTGIDTFLANWVMVKSSRGIFAKFQDLPQPEKKQSCPQITRQIELQDLCIRYGEKVILEHVNMQFDIGKKYALVGESGSGKSSIVRAIIGLSNHYTGKILLDGVDKTGYDSDSIFSQFSYISQNVYLFNDTLRYNLTLGQSYSDQQIMEALSYVNLTEFVQSLPEGLDTLIGDSGKNISGGQRQRIVITRALLEKKKIFIMDEGTSALDQKNAQAIEQLILSNPEFTLILITHHLDEEHIEQFAKIYRLTD